jgi:cytochrome o ubiquinol oxidase operon protein cyoD
MFTLVLVGIMLIGSLWVMYHLDTNMMPTTPHEIRNMP